jgi:hypothetical protein
LCLVFIYAMLFLVCDFGFFVTQKLPVPGNYMDSKNFYNISLPYNLFLLIFMSPVFESEHAMMPHRFCQEMTHPL